MSQEGGIPARVHEMALELFTSRIRKAAWTLKDNPPAEIILLHHNDTDGLTSGAILLTAFTRAQIPVRRFALEKPYPAVVSALNERFPNPSSMFLLADFGSGMIQQLEQILGSGRRLWICDHHGIEKTPEKALLLNGLTDGLTNADFSASAVCAYLSEMIAEWNRDLFWAGALGAFGDGFGRSGRLSGLNEYVWEIVQSRGEGEEPGTIILKGERYIVSELICAVDTLGSVGYFRGGPDVAVKALTEGPSEGFFQTAREFYKERKDRFQRAKDALHLHRVGHCEWFLSGELFEGFGVKSIGLFCEEAAKEGIVSKECFILGFQPLPDSVPGIGAVELAGVKVSVRAGRELHGRILKGESAGIDLLLPKAAAAVGGFVDACHPTAGAATVPAGAEAELVVHFSSLAGT